MPNPLQMGSRGDDVKRLQEVEGTGEWHVLVYAFSGSESIGEKVGTVHVHHEGAATH